LQGKLPVGHQPGRAAPAPWWCNFFAYWKTQIQSRLAAQMNRLKKEAHPFECAVENFMKPPDNSSRTSTRRQLRRLLQLILGAAAELGRRFFR